MVGGVLAAVAVALGIVLLVQGPSDVERRDVVLDVSERFVLALAEYDHSSLDQETDEILSFATGAFREDYETTFGSQQLRDAIAESQSVATAEITVGPLLAALDVDEARTFTQLEQTIETPDLEEPSVRTLRIELLLVNTGSGWKVNGVELT